MSQENVPVKLDAYVTNGYSAPNRCEECDASVPDEKARQKHMEETRHRFCHLCNGYVPLGGIYTHAMIKHENEAWNEHAAAYTDRVNLKSAQPWAVKDEDRPS